MSHQAEAPSCSRHGEEEGHGLHYNKAAALDKTKNHAFATSKCNASSSCNIIHQFNQNSFIEDDLVTWLQYPLDNGAACDNTLQHWPLPSSAPASAAPFPVLKEPPHHQWNDSSMVDITSGDRSLTSIAHDPKTNAHLMQASYSDGSMMQEALKQRSHADEPLSKLGNESAPPALGGTLRQVGDHETQSGTLSRHSEKAIMAGKGQDNNWVQTSRLRHHPQQQGPAYVNFPAHYNAVEGSSAHSHQKEASANPPCRKEESWLGKVSSVTATANLDCSQAMNVRKNSSADAALALGASRAAGVIRPSDMETFSKVRTSLRTIHPSNLGSSLAVYTVSPGSPSSRQSSYPVGYSPPALQASSIHDSGHFTEQMLNNVVQPYWFRPCANFPSVPPQEHQPMSPHISGSNNNLKDSCLESSTTALLGPKGTEGLSEMLKQVPLAEQARVIGTGSSSAASQGIDTIDMQKPYSVSLSCRDKKDDIVLSGGSETSESLKETISGSKRKLDDSECQSEDAEGESAANSQARSSSSKRTRANEVHNLSERRRRNRINDKMNALRELIPNATKSNKAALLDEAIAYLKDLQLQLQVMSMRTGVSLSPMVLPPGLPHMQMPQASPIHPMGIGTTGECSSGMGLGGAGSTIGVAMCDIMYGVPARPLTSVTSPGRQMLQPLANYSNMLPRVITSSELATSQIPHLSVYAPSQPLFALNMDMYNTYLQQQQLQQPHHHPQVPASLQPPPLSQQQSHYQL